ncbi:MAG: hypothetical protein JO193_03355 [Candidatus Eremiobacteraeota bacterium]|nr:hypothetical protein [Candidatus Eremiobacteraeota bacterium]
MLFLLVFGPAVEGSLGSMRFIVFYGLWSGRRRIANCCRAQQPSS